jgi:hypothetical protein
VATDLRKTAQALNIATVAFNQAIEPLCQAAGEAVEVYNGILEKARILASSVTEVAQAEFYVKSEKSRRATRAFRCGPGSSNGR